MHEEIDLRLWARALIDQYGDDAPVLVAQCAEATMTIEDQESKRIWLKIARTIDIMLEEDRSNLGRTARMNRAHE